jgi:hypothetical protein
MRHTTFVPSLVPALVLGTVVSTGVVSSLVQAAVPWTVPNGSSPGNLFDYSGGGSDEGLFGNPVVTDAGFLFFPTNFFAESSNGAADTTRDRLFVTIDLPVNSPANTVIDKIIIEELGDYSILGTGSVKATGLLTATVLDNLAITPPVGSVYHNSLITDPVFPVSTTTSIDGDWTGTMTVDLPPGVTSVQIVLNNVLQATSGAGSTSFIEKKNAGVEITLVIPEPATLSLIGFGTLLLGRRR